MKKAIALFLTLALSASVLAGCGSSKTEQPAENNNAQAEQPAALSGSVATNGSTSMEKVIGALTLMLTGYAEKHGIRDENIQSPIL